MFKLSGHRTEGNPILNQYEMGKQVATGGPEGVWKVYEGHRKSDAKEVSIFVFEKRSAEKLYKPKRRETVTELLRNGTKQLERLRHPRILQVVHPVEECAETLSFASEPVLACLANVLTPSGDGEKQEKQEALSFARDYTFLDVELKYGILQVIYFIKMELFGSQLEHSQEEAKELLSICVFISLLYIPASLTAPLAAEASHNNLRLHRNLRRFRGLDSVVAEAALDKMRRHVSYLKAETAVFRLASESVSASGRADLYTVQVQT